MFELTKDQLKIDSDMEIDSDIGKIVTAYVETWFDVDKKFGIQTADEPETWVNFYAHYNTQTDELHTEYNISRPDSEDWLDYKPTKKEEELIVQMMNECCQEHHGCSLQDYVQQITDSELSQGGLT